MLLIISNSGFVKVSSMFVDISIVLVSSMWFWLW